MIRVLTVKYQCQQQYCSTEQSTAACTATTRSVLTVYALTNSVRALTCNDLAATVNRSALRATRHSAVLLTVTAVAPPAADI
jgi:hypothetical protein